LDDIPSDDETEAAASTVEVSGPSSSSSFSHWALNSSRQQRRSSDDSHKQQSGITTSSSRRPDKPLDLSVKIQLGDLEPQALKPVPLNPDGSAAVNQAAVFVVPRPLEEAVITYRLGLQRGARGSPLLVLVFQYSLLHLLRRSPLHSYSWEEWTSVAHAKVAGLQVCVDLVADCVGAADVGEAGTETHNLVVGAVLGGLLCCARSLVQLAYVCVCF
jgi:hypothetical protein